MISLNLDMPIRILMFQPSRRFENDRLNFLNMEFQLSPIFDLAFYNDPMLGASKAATLGAGFIPAFLLWGKCL